LDGKPILARRTRTLERAYRWVRRNPLVATLSGLMVAAFLGGFAGVFRQWRQTEAALGRAEGTLYIQRVNLADREAQAGNTDRAEVLLNLCPEALRHWEWYYLKRRCHGKWLRLTGHTDLIRCVACSADGKQLASCGNDRTVRIWDTATGREMLTLRGHAGWVNAVVFHADGRQLILASENGNVKVWDVADGRELRNLTHGFGDVTLSPDGQLFSVMQGEELSIHEMETGQKAVAIPGRLSHGKAVAFSPDGSRVADPLSGCLWIWDTRAGREIHLLHKPMPQGVYCMTFSPMAGISLPATMWTGTRP
jgi:hypothetical protein